MTGCARPGGNGDLQTLDRPVPIHGQHPLVHLLHLPRHASRRPRWTYGTRSSVKRRSTRLAGTPSPKIGGRSWPGSTGCMRLTPVAHSRRWRSISIRASRATPGVSRVAEFSPVGGEFRVSGYSMEPTRWSMPETGRLKRGLAHAEAMERE